MIFNSCQRRGQGKEGRHDLFKWSKTTTIPRDSLVESVDDERVGENEGARRRNRARRRRLKSLRFILFNVGVALSFVPRINSNQLATLGFLLGKSVKPAAKQLPRVSNWPLFIALRINNFPRNPSLVCCRHFSPRMETERKKKKKKRGSFEEKKDSFFFHLKNSFDSLLHRSEV